MNKDDIQRVNYEQFRTAVSQRAFLRKPIDLSPYEAFLVLKQWFGPPTLETDDTKIQWHYFLFTPHLAIDVYDWKINTLSIEVFKRAQDSDNEEVRHETEDFLNLLRAAATRHAGKLKSAGVRAKGFVYQNPFALYFKSADILLERASQQSNEIDKGIVAESGDLYKAAFFLYVASLEGLLNLIYEIYLDPSLRDERIYNRLKREQVDIKLRLAPLYCICFKTRVLDINTEEFKRFQFILNLRNDFIHANITKQMKVSVIEEDGLTFWVSNEHPLKYGLPRDPTLLNKTHLETVRLSVLSIVNILLDTMKPRYKREFLKIIYDEQILVDIDEEFIVM